jgi:hypothetical protein
MSIQGQKDRNWLNQQFRRGKVTNATEEELGEYLFILCNEPPPKEELFSRDIIRALTLNHLSNGKIQRDVRDMTRWLKGLTIILVILGLISLCPIIRPFFDQPKGKDDNSSSKAKTEQTTN